jgi:hypothetical protein
VLLNVTAEVLREEVIMKWYKDGHSAKGKSVFLEQMKKFVEWLENASEGECLVRCLGRCVFSSMPRKVSV